MAGHEQRVWSCKIETKNKKKVKVGVDPEGAFKMKCHCGLKKKKKRLYEIDLKVQQNVAYIIVVHFALTGAGRSPAELHIATLDVSLKKSLSLAFGQPTNNFKRVVIEVTSERC